MVRLLAALLFTCCLMAQLGAQAPKDQVSQSQASKDQASKDQASKDQGSTGQAVAPSAKAQFPLDAFQEFSAVMVGSVINGDDREGYIYRSGKLVRTSGPEGLGYFITNLTTLEAFGISATGCIHDRNPYFRSAPFSSLRPGYTVAVAASGQETVDGHSCKIEDVTLSSPKLPKPVTLRFWEADDLQGFPIKVEFRRSTGHNPVIHYKNVVLGPQDPSLFIYPKTCEAAPKGPKTIMNKPATGAKKPAAAPRGTPPQQ